MFDSVSENFHLLGHFGHRFLHQIRVWVNLRALLGNWVLEISVKRTYGLHSSTFSFFLLGLCIFICVFFCIFLLGFFVDRNALLDVWLGSGIVSFIAFIYRLWFFSLIVLSWVFSLISLVISCFLVIMSLGFWIIVFLILLLLFRQISLQAFGFQFVLIRTFLSWTLLLKIIFIFWIRLLSIFVVLISLFLVLMFTLIFWVLSVFLRLFCGVTIFLFRWIFDALSCQAWSFFATLFWRIIVSSTFWSLTWLAFSFPFSLSALIIISLLPNIWCIFVLGVIRLLWIWGIFSV